MAGITRRALLTGGVVTGAALAGRWAFRRTEAVSAEADREDARADTNTLAPPIITRAEWGADESKRRAAEHYDTTIEKLVVHHTGTGNDVSDWAAAVREIYEFEVANGFTDISYNFLIDPQGGIYEGRWARNYPEGAVPDGEDDQARAVRGGHAFAHNPRSIGIALLGNYNEAPAAPAVLDALVRVLGWKCARWSIDPLGNSDYEPTSGESRELPNIYPHTDVTETECPGSSVIAAMDEVRTRVSVFLDAN